MPNHLPWRILGSALLLIAAATPVTAADVERGAALYHNHCRECHESQVHIRDRPKVHTAPELRQQVARWASEINKQWDRDEIEDVTDYLNATYYHFDR